MLGADEGFFDGVVHELHQRIVIPRDVQQPAGLLVHVQLRPGPDLEELFERAGAAGQGDEPVGLFHHHGLAFMHILHHVQFGQPEVRLFLLQQKLRDHADHAAAAGQHFIGHHAHDADHRTAIHQAEVALDEFASQHAGLFDVLGPGSGVGTAVHADVLQSHDRVEGCRSRYRMRHGSFGKPLVYARFERAFGRPPSQAIRGHGQCLDTACSAMIGRLNFAKTTGSPASSCFH
ncbi:hypothetical protein D3C86_1101550 [compost metagenome]